MATIYEAAGGQAGLLRLAEAWHARVLADEVVAHAFSHGYRRDHGVRLASYWAEALGGPRLYSERYGDETEVVRLHSGNGTHEEMDRRAIACFDQALVDAGLSADERLREALHDYFARATTATMARYHASAGDVPEGLSIPRWSWNGLEPAVAIDSSFAGIDWERAKVDLAADGFDNGRSPDALRLSFERSQHVAFARDGGRLVGMARLLSDGVCNAYLLDVWTASPYRRQGIAAAMIRRLLDEVPGEHVGLQTDAAPALYESLGFRPEPEFWSIVSGRWLDNDANGPQQAPQ